MPKLHTKNAPNNEASLSEQIVDMKSANDANQKSITELTGSLNKVLDGMRQRHESTHKDGSTTEKDLIDRDVVRKMNDNIDALQDEVKTLKAESMGLNSGDTGGNKDNSTITQKQALASFARGDLAGMSPEEQKALSAGSSANGGFVVFDENSTAMGRIMSEVSPMRGLATVRSMASKIYTKPHIVGGAASGWVGETASRPETGTATIDELSFEAMEIYANAPATQEIIDDADIDIDEFIASEIRIAFAEQEGTAFITGDGTGKPTGILGYTVVANSAWTWGNVGMVKTGVAGGFAATSPGDNLIDLIYSIKKGYRGNASFLMNRTTQGEVRKLKDGDGNYLWKVGEGGTNPTVLGFGVNEDEDMPDLAGGSNSIAFGDFKRGYLILDRTGLRVLRDPYTNKPYILFYVTKRVAGGIQDFEAIKLLQFAA